MAKFILIYNAQGEIYIRKRTEKGLLSGLYEFPWSDDGELFAEMNSRTLEKEITHVFTHFKLLLTVCVIHSEQINSDGKFVPLSELENYPFSTLMKRFVSAVEEMKNPRRNISAGIFSMVCRLVGVF